MANSSTVGWTLLGFGAALSLLNWVYVYLSWRTGRSHSLIPLIGGVCLLIGALLVTSLRPFAWVAVFADSGTIVVFLAVPAILWEVWQHSLSARLSLGSFQRDFEPQHLGLGQAVRHG
jgi:hypothetical protein